MSTIASGMTFGQYFSQYDTRLISSKYAINAQTNTQYLLGDGSDVYTATAMKLNYIKYHDVQDTRAYLSWLEIFENID